MKWYNGQISDITDIFRTFIGQLYFYKEKNSNGQSRQKEDIKES